MDVQTAIEAFRLFFLYEFLLIVPILAVTMVVTLVFGLLQTMFQIQEQALAFVVKLIVVIVILLLSVSWIYDKSIVHLHDFYRYIFQ